MYNYHWKAPIAVITVLRNSTIRHRLVRGRMQLITSFSLRSNAFRSGFGSEE